MTRFCTNCGAAIPDDAKFCPSCGKPADTPVPPPPVLPANTAARVAAPPPPVTTTAAPITPTPPPRGAAPARSRVGLFAGVAVTIIILGIAVWALLTGMPFGNDKKLTRTQQPAPSVIAEQQPGNTETSAQIRYPGDDQPSGAGRGTEVIATTTTAMPATTAAPVPAATAQPVAPAPSTSGVPISAPAATPRTNAPQPAQPAVQTPPPVRTAKPVRTAPPARTATTPAQANAEITESQAEDILRGYIVSRDYYQLGSDCVGIASQGYKNRGYTIDVVDRCGSRGRVGRWRVDTVTREIFVEKADGRYLRP